MERRKKREAPWWPPGCQESPWGSVFRPPLRPPGRDSGFDLGLISARKRVRKPALSCPVGVSCQFTARFYPGRTCCRVGCKYFRARISDCSVWVPEGSLAGNFRVGFRPIFGQAWPQNPSRSTGLVLQYRLHQKSTRQTNSNAISWRQKKRPDCLQEPSLLVIAL